MVYHLTGMFYGITSRLRLPLLKGLSRSSVDICQLLADLLDIIKDLIQ